MAEAPAKAEIRSRSGLADSGVSGGVTLNARRTEAVAPRFGPTQESGPEGLADRRSPPDRKRGVVPGPQILRSSTQKCGKLPQQGDAMAMTKPGSSRPTTPADAPKSRFAEKIVYSAQFAAEPRRTLGVSPMVDAWPNQPRVARRTGRRRPPSQNGSNCVAPAGQPGRRSRVARCHQPADAVRSPGIDLTPAGNRSSPVACFGFNPLRPVPQSRPATFPLAPHSPRWPTPTSPLPIHSPFSISSRDSAGRKCCSPPLNWGSSINSSRAPPRLPRSPPTSAATPTRSNAS